MLERSIPNYSTMRSLCYAIGKHFIKDGNFIDIGCSNGLASWDFIKNHNGKSILCDVSEPMLDKCKELYSEEIEKGEVVVLNHDLRLGMPCGNADLVMSCLTLQFTPIEYRQQILLSIYESLNKGGALILVEKILGNSAEIDNILVDEYYNIKESNGYTAERIQEKRKSLEGVLVPLNSSFNETMLKTAGFVKVDCFWRCLNFSAWIAIK